MTLEEQNQLLAENAALKAQLAQLLERVGRLCQISIRGQLRVAKRDTSRAL